MGRPVGNFPIFRRSDPSLDIYQCNAVYETRKNGILPTGQTSAVRTLVNADGVERATNAHTPAGSIP